MRSMVTSSIALILNFIRLISADLGTVCLGAAAIFLVRAFPTSVCSECQDLDLRMILASGFFLALGLVLRYVAEADVDGR